MLISTAGTVIKIPVEDVKRLGRSTQGVIVMRLRGDDETVSALAPVVESDETNGDDEPRTRAEPSRRRDPALASPSAPFQKRAPDLYNSRKG